MGEEGHQGADPTSSLQTPFCSNEFPNPTFLKSKKGNSAWQMFLIRPSGCLLSNKTKQSFSMEDCAEKWLSFYKLARVSLSHVCFLCVIIAGEGGESKWFSAWSHIQDSAQLGSPSCWKAGGWQETLLAECRRLFALALNPLYASSHANTSSNQQLWNTGVFV